jgi:hypothetical protein
MDKIKIWVFPGMMSILAAIIWQDVKEIKSDTKALLAQSMIDKTRIDNLEREVFGKNNVGLEFPVKSPEDMPKPVLSDFVATKPEEQYFSKKKESDNKPTII